MRFSLELAGHLFIECLFLGVPSFITKPFCEDKS